MEYSESLETAGISSAANSALFLNGDESMNQLQQYKNEMHEELEAILSWWMINTIDNENGGFIGKIDHANNTYLRSPKGSVLNSRILWAFSSAYNSTGNKNYLSSAARAFNYVTEYFIDKEFGGVYWTVDFNGDPLDTKKQIYALAFAVYGLSEYCIASKNENAKDKAIEIYHDILKNSYDSQYSGYIEALTREWKEIGDLRLSTKDANEKKSMNTHLHLLEAFANLYRVWKDESLKQNIVELIRIFLDHIIDSKTHHLILFFDEQWHPRSNIISYGHDIEAAWLIQEAAEIVREDKLLDEVKLVSVKIVDAVATGLDGDGGLWYEYNVFQDHLIRQKHSWPQAEAMVGFFNAWEITGDKKYLDHSLQSWQFVREYMVDKNLGEWYWGVNVDHSPMIEQDKVGIWKCPYHNSRACLEIIHRIDNIFKQKI